MTPPSHPDLALRPSPAPTPAPTPALAGRSDAWIAIGFLVVYATLDWVSFIEPFGPFGITPWNPCTGVGFALVLLAGRRFALLLFLAPPIADVLQSQQPSMIAFHLVDAVIIGICYGLATLLLHAPGVGFDRRLLRLRDIVLLLITAAVGAMAVACGYVAVLATVGQIAVADAASAVLRYWVGDMIGIAVVTPAILVAFDRGAVQRYSLWFWMQPLSVMLALGLVFAFTWSSRFQLFYVLFLPVFWIGIISGLEGVCLALVTTQIGLMIALQTVLPGDTDITAYQVVMLVLAITGLAVGAVVSERWLAERRLREMQDAHARFGRIASVGAFNAALAHEINQPLSAAATYSRLASEALQDHPAAAELMSVRELADKSAQQVQRAANVIRRLRDLLQLGRIEAVKVATVQLFAETLALLAEEPQRLSIDLAIRIDPDVPFVLADRLQIEQVLINLVRNAMEAIAADTDGARASAPRRIVISAVPSSPDRVRFDVADTGPGLPPGQLERAASAFVTTKPRGLGMGLALCDAIIRAHGSEIVLANTAHGAMVSFTLRAAEQTDDEEENQRGPDRG